VVRAMKGLVPKSPENSGDFQPCRWGEGRSASASALATLCCRRCRSLPWMRREGGAQLVGELALGAPALESPDAGDGRMSPAHPGGTLLPPTLWLPQAPDPRKGAPFAGALALLGLLFQEAVEHAGEALAAHGRQLALALQQLQALHEDPHLDLVLGPAQCRQRQPRPLVPTSLPQDATSTPRNLPRPAPSPAQLCPLGPPAACPSCRWPQSPRRQAAVQRRRGRPGGRGRRRSPEKLLVQHPYARGAPGVGRGSMACWWEAGGSPGAPLPPSGVSSTSGGAPCCSWGLPSAVLSIARCAVASTVIVCAPIQGAVGDAAGYTAWKPRC